MIHYIIGKGGTGKSHKIIEKIDALINENIKNKVPELNNKIYVLVPEQFSFEFDKKLYETIGVFEDFNNKYTYTPNLYQSLGAYKYNSINVNKFSKLAEDIITRHGKVARDYINELSRVIAMYQAIRRLKDNKSLNVFEKQSKNIDFVQLALEEVVDLKKSNITPDELIKKSINFPEQIKNKVYDMASIFAEYDTILKEKNLQDATSDILECSVIADQCQFFKDATIFIDEFDAFSLDELRLIEVMISQSKDFYISLRTDNPTNNKTSYFEPVNKTYGYLMEIANKHNIDTEIIHCDTSHRYTSSDLKNISENIFTHSKKNKLKTSGDVSITKCNDYYQECDYVCSQIRKLIIDGYSYKDIFVTARHVDDYIGIIERAFEKYEIPYFLSTDKASIYTPIMVYFINLLEILSSKKFDTDAILRYVKNPITNIPFEEVADLENYCYKWNVKKSMWENPFQKDDNSNAELVRLNIINPLKQLKEDIKGKSCIEICRDIYSFMENQSIIKNIQNIIDRNKKDNQDVVANEMARLWDMLMTILDTLCTFMGDDIIPINQFKEIVSTMIKQSNYKVAPQKLDAVNFSASDNARYNSPKILFILGLNDGVFPSAVSNRGIFTSSDMQLFENVNLHFFKSVEDKNADEKLIVYKTLSAPAEKMYISYSQKSSLGNLYPSYVVDSILNLFSDVTIQDANNLPVQDLCSTYKASYDYFVRNFWNNSNDLITIKDVLSNNSLYVPKMEYLEKISKNDDLKIQDKNIALNLFRNKIKIYATKFETFNNCHFKYFCSEGLRLRKPVKYDISKIEIGNIIHHCLEKIISSHTKEELINLSEYEVKGEIKKFADQYKEEHLGGDYGKTKRFDANFKRIKNSIYQTIKHIQEEFAQLSFVPCDFELKVDEDSSCKPLSIKNDDGMEILLCGKIDRVDILNLQDNNKSYVRIVDYKSGTQDFDTDKIPYGIDMQMFLYLFAITGKNGKYSDSLPAGVLYLPVSEVRVKNNLRDTTEGIQKDINDHFKMKGVILDDISVIQAMEHDLKGTYIPFKATKNGKKPDTVLTSEQFEKIRIHAENLLIHMANCLSNGDISTKNLVLFDKNSSPCKYCDYWSICGNYPDRNCNFKKREESKKLYENIINGGEDNKNG